MYHSRFKKIISTVLYIIVLFFALWGNNILIHWALSHIILPFFRWFYDINFFIKILIVVFGTTITGIIIFGVFIWITEIVSRIFGYIFIFNKAAYYISILMVSTNILFSAIDMWVYLTWDFWTIFIWIAIFYFIFQMNWTLVLKNREDLENEILMRQIEKNKNSH